MPRVRSRRVAVLLLATATLGAPARAIAQSADPPTKPADPTAEPPAAEQTDPARARAREMAQRGDAEFSAGRCARAISWWQRAEDSFHAPTLLLRIARCQALTGKVVAATATLEAIVAEKLPPDAPPAFADAKRAAVDELPGVRGRIATLTVNVTSDATLDQGTVRVRVDDVVHAGPRPSVRVDPGSHRVDVEAGSASWSKTVTLDEGETRAVSVALRAEQPPPPPSTWRTIGLLAGGVGLAAIAVGVGFGVSASSASSDLDAACGPVRTQCPPGQQDLIDRLDAHALVADVLFVSGGLLAAGGATLAIANPKEAPAPPRLRITPLTATGIQIGGRF